MQILTADHDRFQEFVKKLYGPRGCNVAAEDDGAISLLNFSGVDSRAKSVLERMRNIDVPATLDYFNANGCFTDLEILIWATVEIAIQKRTATHELQRTFPFIRTIMARINSI